MPFAAVNGIDVHYRIAGAGPETIVLVNGLADDLETWAFQEAELTGAGYRLLMFDNRGIGARPASQPVRTRPGCWPATPRRWWTTSASPGSICSACRWAG